MSKKMKLGRALKIRTMELLRMTTSVKQLRKCGAQIGEDVIIWTNKIDKGHAFLLTIGNHVTISDARILRSYDEFCKKVRDEYKNVPVYSTLWSEKQNDEKTLMRKVLRNSIGYDA